MKKTSEYINFFNTYWDIQTQLGEYEKIKAHDWDIFVRMVSTMDIKRRGTFIEKRIIDCNKMKKITGQSAHGDALLGPKIVEIKSSLITPLKSSKVTFRGIRTFHKDVNLYYFVLIDIREYKKSPLTSVYVLTKSDLKREKLKAYTGKKNDRAFNENVEKGITLTKNTLKDWDKYLSKKVKLEISK